MNFAQTLWMEGVFKCRRQRERQVKQQQHNTTTQKYEVGKTAQNISCVFPSDSTVKSRLPANSASYWPLQPVCLITMSSLNLLFQVKVPPLRLSPWGPFCPTTPISTTSTTAPWPLLPAPSPSSGLFSNTQWPFQKLRSVGRTKFIKKKTNSAVPQMTTRARFQRGSNFL